MRFLVMSKCKSECPHILEGEKECFCVDFTISVCPLIPCNVYPDHKLHYLLSVLLDLSSRHD